MRPTPLFAHSRPNDLQFTRYGHYVLSHFRLGIKEPTEAARKHTTQLLVFLAHLLAFRKFLVQSRRRGFYLREAGKELPDLPELVLRRFMELFSSPANPGKYAAILLHHQAINYTHFLFRSERMRFHKHHEVKLINYILIVCLTIDQFVLDCQEISKDLRMQPNAVVLHLQAIGCKRAKSTAKDNDGPVPQVFKLSAPLQFPLPKQPPRRKDN